MSEALPAQVHHHPRKFPAALPGTNSRLKRSHTLLSTNTGETATARALQHLPPSLGSTSAKVLRQAARQIHHNPARSPQRAPQQFGSLQSQAPSNSNISSVPSPSDEFSSRKSNKPLMERRRRQRINKSLDELKALIIDPHTKESFAYGKLEKADILEMAVKFVRQLMHISAFMQQRENAVQMNSFLDGFRSCEHVLMTDMCRQVGDQHHPHLTTRLATQLRTERDKAAIHYFQTLLQAKQQSVAAAGSVPAIGGTSSGAAVPSTNSSHVPANTSCCSSSSSSGHNSSADDMVSRTQQLQPPSVKNLQSNSSSSSISPPFHPLLSPPLQSQMTTADRAHSNWTVEPQTKNEESDTDETLDLHADVGDDELLEVEDRENVHEEHTSQQSLSCSNASALDKAMKLCWASHQPPHNSNLLGQHVMMLRQQCSVITSTVHECCSSTNSEADVWRPW